MTYWLRQFTMVYKKPMTSSRVVLATARCALIVGCVVAGGTAAAADAEGPETLIQQAIELRRKGDHARAYGYLRRAYDLARTPRSAAQLGLVEHALGRYAEAERHLGEALATADPWVQANRARLESSRNFVRSKLGKIEIAGAGAGATVAVGSDPPIVLGVDCIVYVSPGEHTLRVEAPERIAVSRSVTVAAGEVAALAVELPMETSSAGAAGPAAAAVPVAPGGGGSPGTGVGAPRAGAAPEAAAAATVVLEPRARRPLRITGLGVAGGGVALGVAGLFARGIATSKLQAINRDARNNVAYDESNGNWQTFERAGVALMITGGAAVVAGAVVYLLNLAPSSEPAVAFAPATNGGTLSVIGRY
jgi:hypothetical protein